MIPRFRAISLPLIMGVIFSAISVHSFFYNQASAPVLAAPSSVIDPLDAQGIDQAQIGSHVETAGAEVSVSSSNESGISDQQERPPKVEASAQLPPETVSNTLLTDISPVQIRPRDEIEPDLEVFAQPILPQFGGTEDDAGSVIMEEDPNPAGAAQLLVSSRPAARPTRRATTLGRTRETGSGDQIISASPSVSIRPMARPNALMMSVASALPPPQSEQTDLVAAAVSRALVLLPQPKDQASPLPEAQPPTRAQELNRQSLGTILGLFETNTRRWALIENISGRIMVIEPGDTIGSGIVSSISNGSMMVSYGGSVREYKTGNDL